MRLLKKVPVAVLAALLACALIACGGQKPAETEAQTVEESEAASEEKAEETEETPEEVTETEAPETEAPETETETETEPETEPETESESVPEPGHFSDPSAFEGFKQYTCGSVEITFGETCFKDAGNFSIDSVRQFADETHEQLKDPDILEAGAVGRIDTDYWTKTGGQISYIVYNPGEEAAAFEDCVIIGVQDDEGMTFSNGINYYDATPEAIMEILGEPYEIRGTYNEQRTEARFTWRDESGDHVLRLQYYRDADISDMNGLYYLDLSARNE